MARGNRRYPVLKDLDLEFSFGEPVRAKLLASDGPQLQQNVPNPFNSQTVISYFLLAPGPVRLEVYPLTGQRVVVLHQGPKKAGGHRIHWDGRDDQGRPLASGCLPVPASDGRGRLDAQAHPAALIGRAE